MTEKKYILHKDTAYKKLQRIALEIAENIEAGTELIIIGIAGNGSLLAKLTAAMLQPYTANVTVIHATLNKKQPKDVVFDVQTDFNNKHIILVDDVSNSGRTLLYALKPLLEFYPKKIQTLVLVERMHKQFPVKPDYVGLSVATTLQDNIVVEVNDTDVLGAYVE